MTSSIALAVRLLTRSAFAPYGDVIQTDGARSFMINKGTTERFHDLTDVDVSDGGGVPLINIFRGRAFSPPIEIKILSVTPLAPRPSFRSPLIPGSLLLPVPMRRAPPGCRRCFSRSRIKV